MAEYDNKNKGVLFKNKGKDESHPSWADYQGSININGTEFWLSAWIKKSKAGKFFMSLAIGDEKKPKAEAEKPETKKPPYDGKGGFDDMADDIPF